MACTHPHDTSTSACLSCSGCLITEITSKHLIFSSKAKIQIFNYVSKSVNINYEEFEEFLHSTDFRTNNTTDAINDTDNNTTEAIKDTNNNITNEMTNNNNTTKAIKDTNSNITTETNNNNIKTKNNNNTTNNTTENNNNTTKNITEKIKIIDKRDLNNLIKNNIDSSIFNLTHLELTYKNLKPHNNIVTECIYLKKILHKKINKKYNIIDIDLPQSIGYNIINNSTGIVINHNKEHIEEITVEEFIEITNIKDLLIKYFNIKENKESIIKCNNINYS
ncbi:hypothetical protein SLOPH_1113, partial [Spraguea lophii 42_110]